jgi:hypothetical protein
MRIDDLKQFLDRTMTLRMVNGEILKVRLNFIAEDDGEIFAVMETSAPENYRQPCAVHSFAADIASAELSE